MVFRPYYVFATIVQLHPIDDEIVVVARVPFHVLDTLAQFDVVVRPRQRGHRHRNDATIELDTLALVTELAGRLDDKAGCRLSPIERCVLDFVLFDEQLAQRRVFGKSANGQYEFGPVVVSFADAIANGHVSVAGNLFGACRMVAGEPGVHQALVGGQTFLFVFDQQPTYEVFALFGHVSECFFVEFPVACFDIFQGGNVVVAGKR